MTKKSRFLLLMLAATAFNIVITVLCFGILTLLYMALLMPHIPSEAAFIGLPVLFILSLFLAFIMYQRALKVYLKKRPLPD